MSETELRFETVPTQPDWPQLEHRILDYWRDTKAFEHLVELRAGGPRWSFLDGPITANNPMGVHHAWGRTLKDAWQRLKAMQGYDQRWQNGFDCQGLWVEVEVEREAGFKSKRDIEAYGVAPFVRRCKERVLRFAALQTEQSIRLGMWMKWDDPAILRQLADNIDNEELVTFETCEGPYTASVEWLIGQLGSSPWCGSYFTFSDENNYMIWQFLKRCHERGWIYQGTDVMPWCARCGTGLSQHEIATEGYREMEHRSPTLRFPLVDRPGESLLVWTTTPWTLAANVAAAVGPELTYARVRQGEEIFYLAQATIGNVLRGPYEVLGELKGSELVGWAYRGPFDDLPAQAPAIPQHRVIAWKDVGEAEGTGIVHIAPGCGAEDFELGKAFGLSALAPLTEDGHYIEGYGWLTGRDASEVAGEILDRLESKGLLYRADLYAHRYPVCWRCGSELIFRLVDEWFIAMGPVYDKPRQALTAEEKAASLRYQVMDVVDQIHWIPAFGHQRELDWLANMRDWMISKKRYWGLALPIWRCQCGWFDVIGSREELHERAASGWEAFEGHSPHRPYIDMVAIRCAQCGQLARRVADVGNPWLDAGIVPFSTLGYRRDRDYWRQWFPADFITESFPGQFRNWFYSLLAMSTVLANEPPFRNVLGYASLLAEDGREMHKSWGNMIAFGEAAQRLGADVMRWMFLSHRPEFNLQFGFQSGHETRRRFFIPLWNVYSFFVQYANVSPGWSPPSEVLDALHGEPEPLVARLASASTQDLDRWVLLRLNETIRQVTERMEAYDSCGATAAIESFVDDLSDWYVRQSRRRFWEGEAGALNTLYAVLVELARLLAPFLPFTTESMYQNLVGRVSAEAPLSVHHTRWPAAGSLSAADERLLTDVQLIQRLAALGRSARSAAGIKLRQPLEEAIVVARSQAEGDALQHLQAQLAHELNVKRVRISRQATDLVTYSVQPNPAQLGSRFGARLPALRAALTASDAAWLHDQLATEGWVEISLEGQPVRLTAEDLTITTHCREGYAMASEGGHLVGVSVVISPALRDEGLARDLVRHIQQLRKDSGLAIDDRIALTVQAGEPIRHALEAHREYVLGETLSLELTYGPPPEDANGSVEIELAGEPVQLSVIRLDRPTAP